MRIPVNPFWLFVAIALVVLVAIVSVSYRRDKRQALISANTPGAATRSDALATIVVVLALAIVLVPFGIAAAALGGPEVGIAAYGVLLAGALIGRTMWRRSRE